MLIRSFSLSVRKILACHRITYCTSPVHKLFVNNFDKYFEQIKADKENSNHQLARLLQDFQTLSASISDVNKELTSESSTDKELAGLMRAEKVELESQQSELTSRILSEIYDFENEKDQDRIPDSSDIIFEISPGVGGKEAMLFANELFSMYHNFFYFKGWDLTDVEADEQGGFMRHYKAKVVGRDVWSYMKFEAGVHRVQRVPETETKGRIHTSTVSIACIPITDDSGVEINEKDLKIQTKTASGAGGQHVNKTESAIRITHVSSGVTVECQEDRSQIKNREIAMNRLRKILTERYISETFEKINKTRKSQVGRANRNEKIRTYNFNQDRCTDHRLSSLNISSQEKGDTVYDLPSFFSEPQRLDEFIEGLRKVEREKELLEFFNKIESGK